MPAVGLGQQFSGAVGPGSSLCRVRYFYDFTGMSQFSNCSHGTVGRTTGLRSGRYGFEYQPLPTFFNLIIKFRDQNFSETRMRSPTKFFGAVRQKKSTKS